MLPVQTLDAVRTVLALVFLFYASWSDYKTREVSNSVWIIFAPIAFALTLSELFLYEPFDVLPFYCLSFGLTAAFAIVLFYAGGFGGADAKALICIALALPFYPQELLEPLSGQVSPISRMVFPITVFSNAVILVIVPVAYILLRNIYWRMKTDRKLFGEGHQKESFWRKFLVLITGYKVSVAKLKEKWHLYPLEDIEEDSKDKFTRKLIIVSKDEGRNATVDRLAGAVESGKIQDGIWASPGLPMLILITAGLIIALFYGDIVWILVRLLLG
jgi:preflagellin peptidase FlaK